MKRAFYLCALIGLAILVNGCTNQGTTASNTSNASRQGLVGPGSVAPISGGPAGPLANKERFQP